MVALILILSPVFLLSASAAPFLDASVAPAPAPAFPPAHLVSEKLLGTALRARDDAKLNEKEQEGAGGGQDGQEEAEIWTIRDMKRTCSDADNLCEWDFVIDVSPPAPGDPGPVARHTGKPATDVILAGTVSDVGVDEQGNGSGTSAATTTPLQTACKHLTFSSPEQGIPASRATTTAITTCGVFSVTSGWTRVEQPGKRAAVVSRSPPGDVLAAADCDTGDDADDVEVVAGGDGDGAGWEEITDGFTVLSVIDAAKGVLVWPAYSDEEFLRGGEIGDRSYVVQDIP